MAPLFYILAFIFGAIIGSFLNVVVYRYNTGRGLRGRSYCFSCGHALGVGDLVPVVSFCLARGRCRYCGSKINFQYLLVELLTGVVFSLLLWQFMADPIMFLVYAGLSSLLIVIAVYDFRHKIIPDRLAYWFGLLAFVSPLVYGLTVSSFAQIVVGVLHSLLAGGIFFGAFWLLWLISKGRWIGLGDGKLVFGLGVALGLSQGLAAILIGFWLGAIVGLAFVLGHRFNLKSEVPFAPFLVAGFLIALIFNIHAIPF